MSAPEQRDPVEELRQRLERADELLNTVNASTFVTQHALESALEALHRATGREYSASDPAVRAVARELVGAVFSESTEWCVFLGGEDPNTAPQTFTGYSSRASVESLRKGYPAARIAYRTVTRSPWQVVDTEGGEPRG